MSENLSPENILEKVSSALPPQSRKNIIVVGSLAAGHYFSSVLSNGGIRTKDVDCMIWPHTNVKALAKDVTEELIDHGWHFNFTKEYPQSYDEKTEIEKLPMVRLYPKGDAEWFLELLNSPNSELMQKSMRSAEKLNTKHGYFALCGFKYLGLVEVSPIPTQYEIAIASPQMMALANLLHHPSIGEVKIGTTNVKRSNKDLGRVLALAYLMTESNKDLRVWPEQWLRALETKFPNEVRELALRSGDGLKVLLNQEYDFEQAVKTCNDSLLANRKVTPEQLKVTGMRFIDDVIDHMERLV
jgi:hypothetical protein